MYLARLICKLRSALWVQEAKVIRPFTMPLMTLAATALDEVCGRTHRVTNVHLAMLQETTAAAIHCLLDVARLHAYPLARMPAGAHTVPPCLSAGPCQPQHARVVA